MQLMPETENLLQPQFIYCDLTITKSISQVFNDIFKKFGYLDVLCNNAADDNRHNWKRFHRLIGIIIKI